MVKERRSNWLKVVETKAGRIGLVATERGLLLTTLPGRAEGDSKRRTPSSVSAALGRSQASLASSGRQAPPASIATLLDEASRSLTRYYAAWPDHPGRAGLDEAWRAVVALPLDLEGLTTFTRTVLLELRSVPPGVVLRYAELAGKAGSPRAARAVGSILAKNPLPVVVPCHRVISSDGGLGGFAGDTRGDALDFKARLLRYEGWPPSV